jgi:hypothetical protein
VIIGIGGEPATGKSRLVTDLIRYMGQGSTNQFGLLRYSAFGKTAVLGIYDGKPYPGTDRLSMAVQKDAERFVWNCVNGASFEHVLFEGDRLFAKKFLEACWGTGLPCRFLILQASEETKAARRTARKDTKAQTFLAGRATKYRNLSTLKGVEVVPNNTPVEQSAILKTVSGLLAKRNV